MDKLTHALLFWLKRKLVYLYLFLKTVVHKKKLGNYQFVYSPKNKSNIKHLKDRHLGEKAVLIGMGPSLRTGDLKKFENYITFACNKIYLAFNETSWRPTYYCVSDTLVAQNNHEIINKLPLFKIFRHNTSKYLKGEDIVWIRDLPFVPKWISKTGLFFWKDVHTGSFRGGTVLYMQIQMAIWMGIKEIYIVGADFDFDLSKESGEKSDVGNVLVNNEESNHFHPNYRKKGETWAKPNLEMQFDAFRLAQDYAAKNEIKIINASRQSKLKVFERVNFDEVFH